MATRIPTQIGDVLILETTKTYTVYAVERVSEDGQQDVGSDVKDEEDYAAALALARALVIPSRRIFLVNIDANEWSEIPKT